MFQEGPVGGDTFEIEDIDEVLNFERKRIRLSLLNRVSKRFSRLSTQGNITNDKDKLSSQISSDKNVNEKPDLESASESGITGNSHKHNSKPNGKLSTIDEEDEISVISGKISNNSGENSNRKNSNKSNENSNMSSGTRLTVDGQTKVTTDADIHKEDEPNFAANKNTSVPYENLPKQE